METTLMMDLKNLSARISALEVVVVEILVFAAQEDPEIRSKILSRLATVITDLEDFPDQAEAVLSLLGDFKETS